MELKEPGCGWEGFWNIMNAYLSQNVMKHYMIKTQTKQVRFIPTKRRGNRS